MPQYLPPDENPQPTHGARIRQALAIKRLRGERVGTIPLGWRVASDGKTLVPNADERDLVARVKHMQLVQRIPVREIARILACEGITTRTGKPMTRSCAHFWIQKRFD